VWLSLPTLADCLRRVLADPQLRIALGNAARSRALEHFTRQRMVEDHLEIYCRILERRSRIPFPLRVISRKPLPGGQKRAS
jgi:hypothetical protein